MEELCKDILFYNKEHKKFFAEIFRNAETLMYIIWH